MVEFTAYIKVLGLTPEKLAEIFVGWGSDEQAGFLDDVWDLMDQRCGPSSRAAQCAFIRDEMGSDGRGFIAELTEMDVEKSEDAPRLNVGTITIPQEMSNRLFDSCWMSLTCKGVAFRMSTESGVKPVVVNEQGEVVGEATHVMASGNYRVQMESGEVVFMSCDGFNVPPETVEKIPYTRENRHKLTDTKCGYDTGPNCRSVVVFGNNEAPPDCPECHGTGKYRSQVTGDESPCSICCPEETP